MFRTGQTIYIQILSVDDFSLPVTGATFNKKLFLNNSENLTTINSSLTDYDNGIFTFDFTPLEFGMYQMYIKNNSTNALFLSDILHVVPDDFLLDTEIYLGF